MVLNAFKFLFSRDKFYPVLRQGKVLANDAIYSAAAIHPRVGFFARDTLGRRSKFKLENGNEALKFGEKLFGKYDSFPTMRADDSDKPFKTTGFFPKLFVTQPWDRGYVFTRPYFENRYPEKGSYNWGGCGLVAQSIKGERALYYGNTVYGIIASHKNSLSHALVEPKEVRSTKIKPSDLETQSSEVVAHRIQSHEEIQSSEIAPHQISYIAMFDDKKEHCISFERGPATLENVPRTIETERFFDAMLDSPKLPQNQKDELIQLRKEWQNQSPEDPVSAENLNEQARAKDYGELYERRVHRQNEKDAELRATRGFGRTFYNS